MSALGTYDPLYGAVRFPPPLNHLVLTPVVQRLRHIRQSNVDSLSLPGFAGPTRYEHALGAATVATHLGFYSSLSPNDRLVLQAAALLHDTAITPFGHLLEEAFAYVGQPFNHEAQWQSLTNESQSSQPGGAQTQIYLGRETGLHAWAQRTFQTTWRQALLAIVATVRGQGTLGPIVAGPIDVDNIDNVARAAFHIGLPLNHCEPLRLAASIRRLHGGQLVVDPTGVPLIAAWLALRKSVYERLMLAKMDYAGKAMLLAAITAACDAGVLTVDHWRLTDPELTSLILATDCEEARKPLRQWMLGELWPLTDIVWMRGHIPEPAAMYAFSKTVSEDFGRCMAYRIKDKRSRAVRLHLTNGDDVTLGSESAEWLFAIAVDQPRLSAKTKNKLLQLAQTTFGVEMTHYARERADDTERTDDTPRLF